MMSRPSDPGSVLGTDEPREAIGCGNPSRGAVRRVAEVPPIRGVARGAAFWRQRWAKGSAQVQLVPQHGLLSAKMS